jgi:hypothetical protein
MTDFHDFLILPVIIAQLRAKTLNQGITIRIQVGI